MVELGVGDRLSRRGVGYFRLMHGPVKVAGGVSGSAAGGESGDGGPCDEKLGVHGIAPIELR